jgi:hypothetical protein
MGSLCFPVDTPVQGGWQRHSIYADFGGSAREK